MNMHNPKVVLFGTQPYLPGDRIQGKASWGFRNNVSVKGKDVYCSFRAIMGYIIIIGA